MTGRNDTSERHPAWSIWLGSPGWAQLLGVVQAADAAGADDAAQAQFPDADRERLFVTLVSANGRVLA